VFALLAEYPAQAVDVCVIELSVARRGPLGIEKAAGLEETDL
jgi:hypothetical protein